VSSYKSHCHPYVPRCFICCCLLFCIKLNAERLYCISISQFWLERLRINCISQKTALQYCNISLKMFRPAVVYCVSFSILTVTSMTDNYHICVLPTHNQHYYLTTATINALLFIRYFAFWHVFTSALCMVPFNGCQVQSLENATRKMEGKCFVCVITAHYLLVFGQNDSHGGVYSSCKHRKHLTFAI